MTTQIQTLRISFVLLCILFISIVGCKKEADTEVWKETKDVTILAYKSDPDPVTNKVFLNIIYENIGSDTYSKIKYKLYTKTAGKLDSIENTITPTTVFKPKDKRLVDRHIGEEEAKFDDVKVAKVWAVVEEKK